MKTRIRRVRLRIRYKRRSELVALAALALLVPVFLGTLAWGQKEAAAGAQAAPAAFAPMRKYYVTQSYGFDGNETLTACASGYHMASLWEILDPSNLEYNTDLGATRTDSGAGPPTVYYGWVHTGWDSSTAVGVPGRDNCAAWTTDADTANGTIASLPNTWTGDVQDMHIWDVTITECDTTRRVWCVEDYPSFTYLPLVLKD